MKEVTKEVNMAEGRGGKILSITKKRAKRVQEKVRGRSLYDIIKLSCVQYINTICANSKRGEAVWITKS